MLTFAASRARLGVAVLSLYAGYAFGGASSGLVLWNQLGSTGEVQVSSVGLGGTISAGRFVAGRFGTGVELAVEQQYGVTFPIDAVPRTAGCVEFWAKLVGFPTTIPAGPNPTLIKTTPNAFEVAFAPNDGNANGGIFINSPVGQVGTGPFGSWTYARALGSDSVTEWHHFALVWKGSGTIPGVPDTARKCVIYVDGKLNTTTGKNIVNGVNGTNIHSLASTGRLCLMGPTTSSVTGARVIFDNLKIWNYSKTDFSDRFTEGAGGAPCTLTIVGTPLAYGTPSPAGYGIHTNYFGTLVTNSVAALVADGDNTRHLSTGWTRTGSAPASGSANGVSFVITNDTTLTWQWRTEHRLSVAAGTGGSVSAGGWFAAGAETSIAATAADGFRFLRWNDGSTEASRQVTVPPGGITYTAEFAAALELHVVSPHGQPVPACGVNRFFRGDRVEAQMPPPIQTLGPSRLVCSGWLGTGSTPTSGTGNSVSFLIQTNSSLAWYWATECLLNVQAGTGGTAMGSGWYAPGSLVQITASPDANYRFLRWTDASAEASRWVVVPLSGATYRAEFESVATGSARFRNASIRIDERTGAAFLTVERVGGANGAASVSCEPRAGTAKAGSDFTSAVRTVTWAAGDATAKQVRIPIVVDRVPEGDESFTVVLTNPVGVTIGDPATATVTILAWPSFLRPSGTATWVSDIETGPATPVARQ